MKISKKYGTSFLVKSLALLVILVLSVTQNLEAQEKVTNETVLQMVELGFDEAMIIEKINSSDTKFDATISALAKLKKSGVTSKVIALIMKKEKHNSKSKTGIYYLKSGKKTLIQPSVFSGTNSNSAAQRLVSGLINAKVKAQLPRVQSNNVLNTRSPEFEFVFNPANTEVDNLQNLQGKTNVGLLNWWFRVASNPNEFVLVQFKVKKRKNLREVVIGKKSAVSSSSGIDPKNAIPFSIEQIEGNKFKVIANNLQPGEYCFIYQGQVPQGRTNQSVFDFSVQ